VAVRFHRHGGPRREPLVRAIGPLSPPASMPPRAASVQRHCGGAWTGFRLTGARAHGTMGFRPAAPGGRG
jgi:hypothetical protein